MGMRISMPFVGMVMVILAQVTGLILNKEAMASRLNEYVLVIYSNALAVITILSPFLFLNRSSGQLMGLVGLNYASATLSTAMLNLVPAFNYIHTCITIQTWVIRDYPAVLMVTTICGVLVIIHSAAISMITVKGLNVWKLKSDINLIAIGYSAAFEVMLRTGIHLRALNIKGPVYVAMFKPLGLVITLFVGVHFLEVVGFYVVIWGKAQEVREELKMIKLEA